VRKSDMTRVPSWVTEFLLPEIRKIVREEVNRIKANGFHEDSCRYQHIIFFLQKKFYDKENNHFS
jgi:hypothetical protein